MSSYLSLIHICKNIIIQVGRILEEYPHIDEICQSLKGKYEYGNEQYMIIAPSGVEEIILEGRALTHLSLIHI